MTSSNCIALVATLGAAFLVSPPALLAAESGISNADLLRLVRQQATQIEALQKRLAEIEAHERHPTGMAPTGATDSPSPIDAQAEANRSQVQAAIDDVRQSELAVAQAQLAASGSGGGATTRWGKGNEAGPIFSSDDGFFTFKPDGRLLVDFTGTKGSNYAERNIKGSQIASARLGGEGSVGGVGYHLEADFAGNSVALRQAYLKYNMSIFGLDSRVYGGNFLKDLGTEGSSEQARTPFMLRNAAATIGQPVNSSFGLGGQWWLYGDNWHYSLSISGNSPSSSTTGTNTDSIAYLNRAHWNPIKTENGFIHVGAWYYYEKISNGIDSINSTPSIALDYNSNLDVSASSIADPTQDYAAGYELGGVYRNFWLISEYARRTIDSSTADSATRHGSSFSAGWVMTGEKPGFKSRSGNWHGVNVANPVTSGGWGAFELAGRVDHYNFDYVPRGGTGISYTLGLNWYLNDWSRLMFDYIRWNTDNKVGDYQGPDWGNSIGIRTQIVF